MKSLIIRRATLNEAGWMASMLVNSEPWIRLSTTLEQCLRTLNDPEYMIWAAHLSELPSGLVIVHPHGLASSPYIKSIAIEEDLRGSGIGTALMAFVENHFRQESKHIFLCVSSFNQRAQNFYTKLGYRPVGELPDYIIKGESEILMHKRLS
jgi:ribosomal-protein-alanine N-acetyltransferase